MQARVLENAAYCTGFVDANEQHRERLSATICGHNYPVSGTKPEPAQGEEVE
jgi:hypothetical protein